MPTKLSNDQDYNDKEHIKTQLKKFGSILKHTSKKNPAGFDFLKNFAAVHYVSFLVGSLAFFFSGQTQFEKANGTTAGGLINNPLNQIYGNDMTYGHAIKNAYLLEDWRKGEGGVFQGICGLLSMAIALIIATRASAGKVKSNLIKSREILRKLDRLKEYGIDAKKLIKDLEPGVDGLIYKMSEQDKGYFNNLIEGGLDKANYETCVAIVSGYLKSHPKEYNKVVEIIDKASLSNTTQNNHDQGKMISFIAAQELRSDR